MGMRIAFDVVEAHKNMWAAMQSQLGVLVSGNRTLASQGGGCHHHKPWMFQQLQLLLVHMLGLYLVRTLVLLGLHPLLLWRPPWEGGWMLWAPLMDQCPNLLPQLHPSI